MTTVVSMPIPFAINGLGRIGRALTRIAHSRHDLELVAVNDLAEPSTLARLLARDSIHGRFGPRVEADGDVLKIDGRPIRAFRHAEPTDIPWQRTGARLVVDATGTATSRVRAAGHLRPNGPQKVLISAISEDADLMICRGLEGPAYDPDRHHVISNASCTTNCLVLLLDVLDREFGIEHALMNEVHSYTGNQNLVDGDHPDPRRGRAAAVNIVPTHTAAPWAAQQLMPGLKGRIEGIAVRVPTPNVALLDLVVRLRGPVTVEAVRASFRAAAEGRLAGLLAVSDEPLVSSDYIGEPYSAIVDLGLIQQTGDGDAADGSPLVRVPAWYDNEWGYAQRLADVVTQIGESFP